MTIALICIGYGLAVFLLIRFFQTVKIWDNEIEEMERRQWNNHP
jgi:hypothetical protein